MKRPENRTSSIPDVRGEFEPDAPEFFRAFENHKRTARSSYIFTIGEPPAKTL